MIETKIARVTVYEDRADVVREADVEIAPGASVVVVGDLPAVLSDEHVVARVEGCDVHVDDVRVDRFIVGGEDLQTARREKTQRELEIVDDEIAKAEDALRAAASARVQAEKALRRNLEAIARGAGRGIGSVDEWRAGVDSCELHLAASDAARADARAKVSGLKKKRAQMVDDTRPRPTGQKTVARLSLRVSGAGGRGKLIVSTLVPCAAWRPAHEARLEGEAKNRSVRFTTFGAVWNKTGEAWQDVELTLSTARPSAGAELPPLTPDRLTLRTKTPEERKTIVVEHREESVPKTALQGTAPGVDDGGEARVFRVAKATVDDDGRPHNIEVGGFAAPCNAERVAFPELVPQVFLRASLKNAGQAPILAGPVALFVDGAHTGYGDVIYVGPGESFDLSFGSDDRFVVRTKKRRAEDKKLVGKDVVHFIREAALVQTGTTNERVLVHLRLPVSEVKQLKVLASPSHTTIEANTDEHGVVRIPVDLAPNVEKKLALAFSFDASGDVRIPDPW